jgi:hypothetical protein
MSVTDDNREVYRYASEDFLYTPNRKSNHFTISILYFKGEYEKESTSNENLFVGDRGVDLNITTSMYLPTELTAHILFTTHAKLYNIQQIYFYIKYDDTSPLL